MGSAGPHEPQRSGLREVFPGLFARWPPPTRRRRSPITRAYLDELREGALTMLYRLLFALYAEDRDLLPAHDRNTRPIRSPAARRDRRAHRRGRRIQRKRAQWWKRCAGLFAPSTRATRTSAFPITMAACSHATRAPMLDRARLADSAFAPLIDKLSRTEKDGRRVRINFRDLSVRELGAIYEGLLEYEPVVDARRRRASRRAQSVQPKELRQLLHAGRTGQR